MLLLLHGHCSDANGCRRWTDEHGDIARRMQELLTGKQQLQQTLDNMGQTLQERQQQLEQQIARWVLHTRHHRPIASCVSSLLMLAMATQYSPALSTLSHTCCDWKMIP